MTEAPKFSYDAGLAVELEAASPSQEVSSSNKAGKGIDSESTCSCLNASSDRSVHGEGEPEFSSHNDSSIDPIELNKYTEQEGQSPKTCTIDNNDHIPSVSDDNQVEMEQMPQTPDAPCSASSGSIHGINDEGGVYIVPNLGVEFDSEDHAYRCYNRYALMEGFSIRKDFINRSKVTGLVVSRRYTCHRQGYGSTKHDLKMNKHRKETRTGCLAHMTITRQPNGKYRVIHFETNHNHIFVTPLTAYLLPSQKRISFVEAVEAESASNPVPYGVPKLGMGFESEDHAYEFYNSYAGRMGFSVRKDYVNRSKIDGVVASRRYTCFREGHRQKDKRGFKVKRPRKETRVGCMAQLVISRQADGSYRATHFQEQHNHELVPACKVGLLRSQKRSSQTLENCASECSAMQPKSLTDFLLTEQRAPGISYCDPLDEMILTSKHALNIKREEAESICLYFQTKKLKEPSFSFSIQLDVEKQMTNFFWADEKMMVDYGDFGDVVCFDTTYCLNRDQRPLVLFLGINNHRQILVYGAAFLYDDTVQSFKWLFRTFIKSMSGKIPKTILTDQGSIISKAIVSELPDSQHRLCTWQIYQNTLKQLSEVVANSDSFASDLCGCFFNPDKEDFISSWKGLLDTYGLWENKWLHRNFESRENWALSYGKHVFSADMETVLLSEDSIISLRKYLKPESHILRYIKHFGRVLNGWRYKDMEANYDMGQHVPKLMGNIIMLKQVRNLYTPIIFEMFHREYENFLNLVINQFVDSVSSVEYTVCSYGQVREYEVLYIVEYDSVVCSCMKFQSVGILCSHALKVLDCRNVKIVPSQYVLKRWTRDARA